MTMCILPELAIKLRTMTVSLPSESFGEGGLHASLT